MGRKLVLLGLAAACVIAAQPKRVLYVTTSAGYRHDSIPTSIEVLRALAPDQLQVTATEDLSTITADGLRAYDAVFFFTSGELALSGEQKTALVEFVRAGKGFGGAHSATDTLYTWPEYKNLIGATFDYHPWTQRVRIDIEDPTHPLASHLAPGFEIEEEIYQFRDFSRDRLRVLMTLDTSSVDMSAPGINRTDGDFALAWVQPYGQGRVFYTALGHMDTTWRDTRFQQMLRNGLLWLTGQMDAPAAPRPPAQPRIAADSIDNAIANAASFAPRTISPGTIFTVYGDNFTVGSDSQALPQQPTRKLAGAVVLVNGAPAPIFYASPRQINALAPMNLPGPRVEVDVVAPGVPAAAVRVSVEDRTPGVFATTTNADGTATIWATGLGAVRSAGDTLWQPRVEINGTNAPVLFSGLAPGWMGLYQVNVRLPVGAAPPFIARLLD
jgi:uncharacterized protein (TIGR03437 family)